MVMHDRNLDHPVEAIGVPFAVLFALKTAFMLDRRVVYLTIDGEKCAVPLVLVLYLLGHPPRNTPERSFASRKPSHRYHPYEWDGKEVLVWTTHYGG